MEIHWFPSMAINGNECFVWVRFPEYREQLNYSIWIKPVMKHTVCTTLPDWMDCAPTRLSTRYILCRKKCYVLGIIIRKCCFLTFFLFRRKCVLSYKRGAPGICLISWNQSGYCMLRIESSRDLAKGQDIIWFVVIRFLLWSVILKQSSQT